MRTLLIILSGIFTALAGWLWYHHANEVRESITYFPADPDSRFLEAKTGIDFGGEKNGTYEMTVKSSSILDRSVYLRQDITLVFFNGVLIGKTGVWKGDVSRLDQQKIIRLNQGGLLQAISFHHGEIHRQDGSITGIQTVTGDSVFFGNGSPHLYFFRNPETAAEQKYAETLTEKIRTVLEEDLGRAASAFGIDRSLYRFIPLTEINRLKDLFPQEMAERIFGRLVEGLYKNYFLGIRKEDEKMESPIGSHLPVIWISKNKDHLLVTFVGADGKPHLLKQQL
jgi:hypothetical protein